MNDIVVGSLIWTLFGNEFKFEDLKLRLLSVYVVTPNLRLRNCERRHRRGQRNRIVGRPSAASRRSDDLKLRRPRDLPSIEVDDLQRSIDIFLSRSDLKSLSLRTLLKRT